MVQTEIVEYSEIKDKDFDRPLLADKIGEEIVIESFRIEEGAEGSYCIVSLDGSEFRTTSRVLMDQLNEVREFLRDGKKIKAELSEVESENGYSYLTLE